jgi:hypothetical protein
VRSNAEFLLATLLLMHRGVSSLHGQQVPDSRWAAS